jgi:hypothetical protein
MGALVFFESTSELATLTNTFEVGGTPTDPTTVSLVITDPTSAETSYTFAASQITQVGTGVYSKDIACSIAGEWTYEWIGTGSATDTNVGTWTVFDRQLGHLYATPQVLKSRINAKTEIHEYELVDACYGASRAVEQHCERIFYRTPSQARTFVPCGPRDLRLGEFNDLVSITSVRTDTSGDGVYETSWTAADYQLSPLNPDAAPERRPFESIRAVGGKTFPQVLGGSGRTDRVEITGVWGWPAVPHAVKTGALILAQELFRLKDAPFGVADFGEAGLIRLRENPRLVSMLLPYQSNPLHFNMA